MGRPKVLMACPHYWTSPFQVGGHHLARAFVAAGWDVGYISNPISPLHAARGLSTDLRERAAIYRPGGISDLDGHLWTYVPGAIATPHNAPLLRGSWLHHNWHRLSVPNVVRAVRERGFGEVDLLYFDSVVQRFWLEAVPHRRSVLRVADRMTGFGQFTVEMLALQRELASSVDLVVYTAHTLEADVIGMAPRRTLHLPNGVDFAHFAEGDRSVPDDLTGISRPIAMYVGAMDEWFDFEAVDAMTAALPEVSFVLIGPDELARSRLARQPNLYLLGRRAYGQLPRYLHNADVGLIPFDVRGHSDLVNGIHPLKLYEYLACGLPVVATRWDEIAQLSSPALLYRTPQEGVAAIRRALSEPTNRAAAIDFAGSADWGQRVQALLKELAF